MGNKKVHYYGILGSGTANETIIKDGLMDVFEGQEVKFLIHARRRPQGSVTTVWDFLDEHEATFVAYHRVDDNPPKALLDLSMASNIIDDPAKAVLTVLAENKGTLLLLWDEENPEASTNLATMAISMGVPVKDLTNGLSPIIAEADEPEEEVVEETTPAHPFSRDELMNMNIGVLRRQAKAIGIENLGRITKQEIVDAICSLSDDNREVDIDTDMSGEFVASTDVHNPSDIGNGFFTWLQNGEVQCHPLPPIMVKWLIEELKTA